MPSPLEVIRTQIASKGGKSITSADLKSIITNGIPESKEKNLLFLAIAAGIIDRVKNPVYINLELFRQQMSSLLEGYYELKPYAADWAIQAWLYLMGVTDKVQNTITPVALSPLPGTEEHDRAYSPFSMGTYCPVCGDFTEWKYSFKCKQCGREGVCHAHKNSQGLCSDCAGGVTVKPIETAAPVKDIPTPVQADEDARRRAEAERLRREQEAAASRLLEEQERARREQETSQQLREEQERVRREQEAEAQRLREEQERLRQQHEAEMARMREEQERLRREQELEAARLREEADRMRRQQEEETARQAAAAQAPIPPPPSAAPVGAGSTCPGCGKPVDQATRQEEAFGWLRYKAFYCTKCHKLVHRDCSTNTENPCCPTCQSPLNVENSELVLNLDTPEQLKKMAKAERDTLDEARSKLG